MVGQEQVDMVCLRMEDPYTDEMHRAWFFPSDDRPAVVVSSLATLARTL